LIAAIFSVIAAMYYIRLIKLMFFKDFDYWTFLMEIPKVNSFIISGTFFFNILFFCYPEIIVVFIFNNVLNVFY
jgi:NADH:ubiquinone oxidoreductase subunit 2 (subunit N)